MSSVELARRLGTRQPTAWLLKHKLMAAMAAREAGKPKLEGRVEVDDAYLGGQRSGGKRGRGRPARRRSSPRSRRRPSASPGGCGSRVGQGLPQAARSRRWPSATSPPAATSSPMACPAGRRSRRPAARTSRWSPAVARRPPAGCPSPLRRLRRRSLRDRSRPARLGQHRAGQHQDRARRDLPSRQRQARPALPHQLRLALVWGFGCQALNVGMVFLPVSSSSRWRQPSRGLVHDVPRGARPLARIIAPQACIRWTRGDPDHDAAMRIGGEAPGRRAHSSTRHESHRKARVTATSDRHRQPAGEPWADRETVSAALLRPSPLTPPDAGRHRPASRRWSPNATAR